MPLLSVFIPVPKDFIQREFTVYEAIYNAVRGADEVVLIMDRPSESDYTLVHQASKGYEQKITIYVNTWNDLFVPIMYSLQKNLGISHCTGDWVFAQDADEVVSLKVYDEVKVTLLKTSELFDGFTLGTTHLYGDYFHFRTDDPFRGYPWYNQKLRVFRRDALFFYSCTPNEIDELIHLSDVRPEQAQVPRIGKINRKVHHYGHVRSAQVYTAKKNSIEQAHNGANTALQDLYHYNMSGALEYTGLHPEIMLGRIACGIDHIEIMKYYQELYLKGRKNG